MAKPASARDAMPLKLLLADNPELTLEIEKKIIEKVK